MQIEIAHVNPTQQSILEIDVPAGSTIEQVLGKEKVIEIQNSGGAVGIFGKQRSFDWPLKAGDRLEIYQPLINTPNQSRLKRAKQSKSKTKKN